jgi:NAD(P)-dependent dehydrogenase (short-subunit alcohol dehydrogenase family)
MKTSRIVAAGTALVVARGLLRRTHPYDVRDKVIVVTGGSRGLGLVLARQLVARGAKVAICARDSDELGRAHADLIARGGMAIAVPCDLTDRVQIATFIEQVVQQLGPIDVLINNAGVIQVGPMELMTIGDFEQAMRTHFWAPLQLAMAVLPEMRARREGRIVNITSIGGKVAVPHLLPYTASKFALVGLSEGMRAELAKDNVHVTTVVPGLMRTGSPLNAIFKGRHRAEYTWFTVGDSLPVTSMAVERAAAQTIDAMCRGDAEVVLSIQAKLVAKLGALAPNLVQGALALVNRLLPKIGGIGPAGVRGRHTGSLAPAILTRATDRAALRNNEV